MFPDVSRTVTHGWFQDGGELVEVGAIAARSLPPSFLLRLVAAAGQGQAPDRDPRFTGGL